MAKPVICFYIFHGNDDVRLNEEIQKMHAQMGDPDQAVMNISEFDGETTPVMQILNAAASFPFLSDKRLVIVKGLLRWITRKGAGQAGKDALAALEDQLPQLPDTARLVFVENAELPKTHKILKLAQSLPSGYERAFNTPKDPTQWIIKRVRETYEAEIEPQAAYALASVIGEDLRRADNEIIKLVIYVDGERPITEADVSLLTPYVAETTAFALVDALATRRGKAAFELLYTLLQQKDEDPFRIYGMIIRQFRMLLLAKEHLLMRGGRGGLAEALAASEWAANKAADQSRAFTLAQLEEIYRTLQDYDFKMKTGNIAPQVALDMLVAGLAR